MTRFNTLYPQFVGFDQLFSELERMIEGSQPTRNSTFPPHNIVKVDDNKYVIEMAVAGFGESEIDIEIQNGLLVVKGEKKDRDEVEYVYRGIATRSFIKSIRLNENIEVRGAQYKDGILKIALENVIPEHKKARKIAIGGDDKAMFEPKLLQESH